MSKTKAEELGNRIKEFFEVTKTSTDASSFEALKSFLEKARRRMSDEAPDDDESEPSLEESGYREFDPDSPDDDADKWLQANDPEKEEGDEDEEPEEDDYGYDEYAPDEDEDAHQRDEGSVGEPVAEEDQGQGDPSQGPQAQETPPQEVGEAGRFYQPSREEVADLRQYTRPWEQRARDKTKLDAEAAQNPVLHHEGRLTEARALGHKDRNEAYQAFQASPEFQGADPITQMEMEAKFNKDWHGKNPEYLGNAMKLHGQAHLQGLRGAEEGAGAKKEKIEHIMGGGAQPEEPMSVEEAMQHAGGTRDEDEGTTGAMVQDPATAFARQHQQFLSEKGGEHKERASKRQETYRNIADRYQKGLGDIPAEYTKGDAAKVLGDHPALKDPKNKAKMDTFFQKYHPLIQMSSHRVLNKLGLDKKNIDMGLMHEAGMHGLFQALNDYEHDNPAKASFATHAGHKIRGLMHTALRDQIKDVPHDLKAIAAKHHPDVQDRLKRIDTNRKVHIPQQPQQPKIPKPEGGGE